MPNPVADELAIRQLVASYADAVNRVDEDQWAQTWANNCTWVLAGLGDVDGKVNVVGMWQQAMKGFAFVVQLVDQGTVFIDGDNAKGRWYLSEHLRPVGSSDGLYNIGTYADEYQKVEGEWLFTRRDYHILYNDEGKGDMSGIVTRLPF